MPSPENGRAFATGLHKWYEANKRDLPWRKTTDPYKILVSEVMLQQTQVDRVIPKYTVFLETFPTVQVLAKASPAAVIALWHGLGYNRRALNLHKGARTVVEECNGNYPSTPEGLQEIPGIGPYTAAAVSSFAFNHDAAVVDTNVIRVLTRLFIGINANSLPPSRKEFDALAKEILPKGTARVHNNAIMEFGALICQAKPSCGSCFASKYCLAFKEKENGILTEDTLALLGTPKGGFGTVQSKFEGSNRQVRGEIVRHLKDLKTHDTLALHKMVQRSLDRIIDPKMFSSLLQNLEKEGMVVIDGESVSLPSD